jgi:hypothetical protein
MTRCRNAAEGYDDRCTLWADELVARGVSNRSFTLERASAES